MTTPKRTVATKHVSDSEMITTLATTDWHRIKAALAAVEGISTEALESGALAKVLEAAVYVAKEFWKLDGADGSGGYDAAKDLRRALGALGRLP